MGHAESDDPLDRVLFGRNGTISRRTLALSGVLLVVVAVRASATVVGAATVAVLLDGAGFGAGYAVRRLRS